MMRTPDLLYQYVDDHPRHLIIPHRLMAYPVTVSYHRHDHLCFFS
jgi:hypothetical protein